MIAGLEEEPDTAQKQPEGIIYDTGEEADSVMPGYVFSFPVSWRDVKIRSIEHPSLDPTGVQMHNATYRMDGRYYTDLGALGTPQRSLFPYSITDLHKAPPYIATWYLQPEMHPVYRVNIHEYKLFQTQKPYTLFRYGSSLNKDYQIGIVHTQNIIPRWNIAFLYDLVSRKGDYTNSDVTNHVVDFTTNYYSADARYQLQASFKYNRFREGENGGVVDDSACWDYTRRAGAPVHMNTAKNQWRDIEVHVHQTYNTVRQFYRLQPIVAASTDSADRDSIIGYDTIYPHEPHLFNTGVFGLDLDYARHRRIFYDDQPYSWYYRDYTLDTTFYYDSTKHYKLAAELFWTNDAYMTHRWKNPILLTFGIRPEYNMYKFDGSQHWQADVTPFARATIHIGEMKLEAEAEETTGDYRNGDYRIAAALSLGKLRLAAASEAVEPAMIFHHNEGVYNWDNSNLSKIKRQQIAADFRTSRPDSIAGCLRWFSLNASATLLSDNIWIDTSMTPVQGDATGLLLHGTLATHIRFGWFNIRLQESLQYSSNEDVERIPLFASKNSLYADFYIFHRALRVQTGFDLRYHTRYKADGWNPVLAMYYRQDDVKVGGYMVADFWLNLQIKRASIYIKASHFNAPLEEMTGKRPDYFSMPHYPMEDFNLYWGVIWKFFD